MTRWHPVLVVVLALTVFGFACSAEDVAREPAVTEAPTDEPSQGETPRNELSVVLLTPPALDLTPYPIGDRTSVGEQAASCLNALLSLGYGPVSVEGAASDCVNPGSEGEGLLLACLDPDYGDEVVWRAFNGLGPNENVSEYQIQLCGEYLRYLQSLIPNWSASSTPAPESSESSPPNEIVVGLTAEGEELIGDCRTPSLKVARPNAWRCSAQNRIYDPCFSEVGEDQTVVCATSPPWVATGSRMTLTEPLPPTTTTYDVDKAWGLELADGVKCSWLGGGTGVFEGERINYACEDGWYVAGASIVEGPWKAQKVLLPDPWGDPIEPLDIRDVSIVTVWR